MKITKELAELVGILYGDGCLSNYSNKYMVYICGHKIDDREYHEKITINLFLKIFNKKVKIETKKQENTLFLRFSDKKIFNELNALGMPVGKKYDDLKIPPKIKEDFTLMPHFIRGLVDTDGCIVFSKQHRQVHYYPRIEITSKSKALLLEVFDFLQKQNMYGSISDKGGCYRLEIPGFKNLKVWLSLIGFDNPKHINKIKRSAPGQKIGR